MRLNLNSSAHREAFVIPLMPLELLGAGEWGEVEAVTGEPGWVGRLAELGIRNGSHVQVLQPGSPCLLERRRLPAEPPRRVCLPGFRPPGHGVTACRPSTNSAPASGAASCRFRATPRSCSGCWTWACSKAKRSKSSASPRSGDPMEIRLGDRPPEPSPPRCRRDRSPPVRC